jgi:hypothetical protein
MTSDMNATLAELRDGEEGGRTRARRSVYGRRTARAAARRMTFVVS